MTTVLRAAAVGLIIGGLTALVDSTSWASDYPRWLDMGLTAFCVGLAWNWIWE